MIERLEVMMERLIVLILVLAPVLWFLLEYLNGDPPVIADADSLVVFAMPGSKPVDIASREIRIPEPPLAPETAVSPKPPRFNPALGSRDPAVREFLAVQHGGGKDTEEAVEAGLSYLSGTQDADGSWGTRRNPVPTTATVLAAFLGAGYHHKAGKHRETVSRGIAWLQRIVKDEGAFAREPVPDLAMIATVLAEAHAMADDAECREAAARITAWLVRIQGAFGGWSVQPYNGGAEMRYDTAATAALASALQAARLAGIHVEDKVLDRYREFCRNMCGDQGLVAEWWAGQKKEGYRSAMTAASLCGRLLLGEDLRGAGIRDGIERLGQKLPSSERPRWVKEAKTEEEKMEARFWLDAAQASFLAGPQHGERFYKTVKDLLLKGQVKQGPLKGSWDETLFRLGGLGGPAATALCVMVLETPYRYCR